MGESVSLIGVSPDGARRLNGRVLKSEASLPPTPMKHISRGYDRLCGTPVPESGEYVTDAEWRELPECPTCFNNYTPKVTIEPEPIVTMPVKVSKKIVLRDYL